jgi:glycosyltransferase involved in cell wall biosynthesis
MPIYGCIPNLAPQSVTGLKVANDGFLAAALRYGDFDEYHVFLTFDRIEAFRRGFGPLIESLDRPVQVRIVPYLDLPKCLAEHTYAAFHVGSTYLQQIAWLRRAYARRPFPVTGVTHSLSLDPALDSFAALLDSPLLPCDAIVCTSRAGHAALEASFAVVAERAHSVGGRRRRFSGRLPVIPLGVDADGLGPVDADEQRRLREGFKLPVDKTLVLCLGRLSATSKMDLHPLLVAFREAIDRETPGQPPAALVIAGKDYGDRAFLKALAERAAALDLAGRLLFQFNFRDDQKRAVYAAADAFVSIPDNVQETFGIAPVEAMMSGLPVVLSAWSGYRELIDDGVEGYLVPTCWARCDERVSPVAFYDFQRAHLGLAQSVAVDVGALASRLAELIASPERRRTMGAAGRARAVSRFSWLVVMEQYNALWRELGQVAAGLDWTPGVGPHGSAPYYNLFRHYASRTLAEDDRLTPTRLGRATIAGQYVPFAYDQLEGLLNVETALAVLRTTAEAPDGTLRLASLHAQIGRTQEVDYHVLWLLKQHLLALGDVSGSAL